MTPARRQRAIWRLQCVWDRSTSRKLSQVKPSSTLVKQRRTLTFLRLSCLTFDFLSVWVPMIPALARQTHSIRQGLSANKIAFICFFNTRFTIHNVALMCCCTSVGLMCSSSIMCYSFSCTSVCVSLRFFVWSHVSHFFFTWGPLVIFYAPVGGGLITPHVTIG